MTDSPKHVLVADDDEASRYLVESLLRGAGYTVSSVSDGEQALEAARSGRVDLLVTDVLMPRMDGYRLVRAWKADAALSSVPVVFYTATYTDPADEHLASDIGVDRFLTKPQDPEVLLRTVADLLSPGRAEAGSPKAEEAEVLREYSERLVSKLEDKVAELDAANGELRHALTVLSEEIGVKNALIDRLNTDIMNNERAQRALREANDALDAVIASSPLPMIGLDEQDRVTIWNVAAQRVFGWSADEVLGRVNPAIPDEQADEHRRLFEATRSGETIVAQGTRRLTKDGRLIDVEISTARLAEGCGAGRDYIAVYQDVTERRRAEQVKSDFVSALSHELRTPLTAIVGYTDLLSGTAGIEHPECREMADRIRAKAVELDRLVERLLEAASIQAGSTTISPRPTDIELFLEAAVRRLPVPEGSALELEVESDLPQVRLDRDRLGRALSELVGNAFKYSPAGGAVRVSARRQGGRLLVSVSDEGLGIAGEDAERIFERFTQVDMSSTREFPGIGLGLYVARQVVEAHGGRIGVESEAGAGSTFTIDLPLA